jgi:exodeoxyribonuclease V alpha subunit
MMSNQGLAKRTFRERYGHAPWSKDHIDDSLLSRLLKENYLSYLNYYLINRLFSEQAMDQEMALLVCHLFQAIKEGHLCIEIKNNDIQPSVDQIWKDGNGQSLPLLVCEQLKEAIIKGEKKFISLSQCDQEGIQKYQLIWKYADKFYFSRFFVLESIFLSQLEGFINSSPNILLKPSHNAFLLPEQQHAIQTAFTHSLTLISGGPGTGKTYTAGYLIKEFWQQLPDEKKHPLAIALAAPTGKAAANLQRSLAKATADLTDLPFIKAKTLHALLGIKKRASDREGVFLSADLVIIDEASMIDIKLMIQLLKAMRPGTRLVLLGDHNQLPSIEAGSLFAELLNAHHLKIGQSHLNKVMRTDSVHLCRLSHLINQGAGKEALQLMEEKLPNIHYQTLPELGSKELDQLCVRLADRFVYSLNEPYDAQLLAYFNAFRILSPLRNGPYGVEAINQQIGRYLARLQKNWIAIPIMILENDYRLELFNGETGVLIQNFLTKEEFAIFSSNTIDEPARKITANMLPKYEYAYCLSVHKSQGSEYDQVALLLPEGSQRFGRELFYTAITRARKSIEIYSNDSIILKTIERQGSRLSGIQDRLFS